MKPSSDTKAVIALTTRLGDKERPSLSPTRWHHFSSLLRDASLTPAGVFDAAFDPAELPGIKTETVSTIRHVQERAAPGPRGHHLLGIQDLLHDAVRLGQGPRADPA